MPDAEFYEPGADDKRRHDPEDKKAAVAAFAAMTLFMAVITDIGACVIAETEKHGDEADIPNAVLDALESRGDQADEIRAGLWGLCMLAASEEDDEEDDRPAPQPTRPRPKRGKGKKKR